jgi:hypothetical protein
MSDRSSFDTERTLPCGHTLGALLTFAADRTPTELADHVETCPYCPAELAELDKIWGSVRRSARVPVQPPDGLVERALATVRALRADSGAGSRELDQDRGVLRIAPQAVLTLTRQACSEIVTTYPGVSLRSCSGDVDEVRVDLVVRYPLPARELAVSVQAELARALRAVLGAAAPSVSAQVIDIAPPID